MHIKYIFIYIYIYIYIYFFKFIQLFSYFIYFLFAVIVPQVYMQVIIKASKKGVVNWVLRIQAFFGHLHPHCSCPPWSLRAEII